MSRLFITHHPSIYPYHFLLATLLQKQMHLEIILACVNEQFEFPNKYNTPHCNQQFLQINKQNISNKFKIKLTKAPN